MFLISAKYIFKCDDEFNILKDSAVVFDESIVDYGDVKTMQKKYPNAKFIDSGENSLLLPAFINPHTHLEFSANSYDLSYGDFLLWLNSVMKKREALSEKAKEELILQNIKLMQESGTATIGEISSFGSDLSACVKSSARIIFFNEILGVNEEANEAKKEDFLKRFYKSKECENELFIPALSLHSPYSLNLSLAKFALDFASKNKLLVSTHFLESKHEKLWLEGKTSKFKPWLSKLSKEPKPHFSKESFVSLFKGQRTLFTHCVFVDDFSVFDKKLHSITHCVFSNRLLSKKTFKLKRALTSGINVHIGTDGLSSNISLCMLDELRASLLSHRDLELKSLAKTLILMATQRPAKALNLKLGQIKKGYWADFALFKIKECEEKDLALNFILNAKKAEKLYIKGRQCL